MALPLAGTACGNPLGKSETQPAPTPGRLVPPAQVRCDRNHLTSYAGVVSAYEPGPNSTRIEITTDWSSVEGFTLPHANGRTEDRFLMWGKAFKKEDWPKIESTPGELAAGLRAIVWVCEDSAVPPVVDWRPGK